MKKLKVAVIGCGNIFPVHANAIDASANAELRAVVDINEDRAVRAAEEYNCNFYVDCRQFLANEDIDVAHICTPHHEHAPIAMKLLKAGIDVLVEKPLAINTKQAAQIIATAKEYNRSLGVVFQNRFNENVLKAKNLLFSSSLGKIKGIKGIVTWFRDKAYYQQADWRGKFSTEGGGVLINQAIHTLDLLQWFGGDIEAIQGHVSTRCLNSVIEVEDTADATIFFKSGAIGIYFATNCYSSNSPVVIEFDCERGKLILDGGNLVVETEDECEEYNESQCCEYKSYWGYGHKTLIDGFYQDILHETSDFTVSGEEGIKTLKMIETIYKSSDNGKKEIM
ncbi:MAG: Gfo/Idh/MocA family protein [Halanaerobiales bacterium]